MDQTKKCPLCAEEIKAEAIKCKHCKRSLAASKVMNSISIKELIQQLESDEWKTADQAQRELEEIGEPAEALLKEAIQNPDSNVRNRATFTLKSISIRKRTRFSSLFLQNFPDIYRDLVNLDISGKFNLLKQITQRDSMGIYKYRLKVLTGDIAGIIGEIILESEEELNPSQIDFLLAVCEGKKWFMPVLKSAPHVMKFLGLKGFFKSNLRRRTIELLGRLGYREVIPELMKLLDSEGIRDVAIEALGRLGAKEAISKIVKILREFVGGFSDYNDPACSTAVRTLGQLGAKESIPLIIKLLNNELAFSIVRIRSSLAFSLGQLGVKEAIPQIRELLKDKEWFTRATAAVALGRLEDKDAILDIMKLLKDDVFDVRRSSIFALGLLDAKIAIPEIKKLLDDKEESVRKKALFVLVQFGVTEAILELIKLLEVEDIIIRDQVIRAFSQLDSKSANEVIPEIKKLIKDDRSFVRSAAVDVLRKLGLTTKEIEKAKE